MMWRDIQKQFIGISRVASSIMALNSLRTHKYPPDTRQIERQQWHFCAFFFLSSVIIHKCLSHFIRYARCRNPHIRRWSFLKFLFFNQANSVHLRFCHAAFLSFFSPIRLPLHAQIHTFAIVNGYLFSRSLIKISM